MIAAWALSGCGLEAPARRTLHPDPAVQAITGDPKGAAAINTGAGDLPACLPVLSGELVINEVLARPAGLDIDGDGQSSLRDEAIEIRLVAAEPRHLEGVALAVAGQPRGVLADPRCHAPGTLFLLVGATAASPALQSGAEVLRLSGQLALRDDGAHLSLTGRADSVIDQLSYPAAPAGRSQVRAHESDFWAPLEAHPDTPGGAPHSLGQCRDGAPAASCWPSTEPG
jgi:hypothetical protein